jgi:hypothetical protein
MVLVYMQIITTNTKSICTYLLTNSTHITCPYHEQICDNVDGSYLQKVFKHSYSQNVQRAHVYVTFKLPLWSTIMHVCFENLWLSWSNHDIHLDKWKVHFKVKKKEKALENLVHHYSTNCTQNLLTRFRNPSSFEMEEVMYPTRVEL